MTGCGLFVDVLAFVGGVTLVWLFILAVEFVSMCNRTRKNCESLRVSVDEMNKYRQVEQLELVQKQVRMLLDNWDDFKADVIRVKEQSKAKKP